jgi:bis(5'-nucleosyl)-tetraphosphatase (symmetrical)
MRAKMATYAIGDVQGCCGALEALLRRVDFSATRDRLWFVGDLVNRGPQSLEVLRLIKGLGSSAIVTLGNHDLHLVALAAGHAKTHRGDTLDAVLKAPDRDELVDWLRTRRLAYADAGYLMVHAGLLPQWSAADVLRLAGEVEAVLASASYASFLEKMYGNDPAAWSETLRGTDRLRTIVNAMTRMRFCTRGGEMEFREKGSASKAPAGYQAWFDVPGRKTADKTVVCGHWSALGYVQRLDLIALDSGCVWGGCLTAVRLEDRQPIQVTCESPGVPMH